MWSAYSTFELFLTCNAKSDLRAEEKHRYLHFNYVFYASVIQMSVTDANALELNYKKKNTQRYLQKSFPAWKNKEKEASVSASLRTTAVWMPTLAADTHHTLFSNMAFVASWCTMPV